jgi:sulfite exporter TauE/SafE
LAIHVERNNETAAVGQIPNNSLRETVRNPKGIVITSNEFTRGFFSTFKPDITVYNLGYTSVSVGVLVGNLPFMSANNQVNLNSLSGVIAGSILIVVGIIVLIAGGIVVALDRRKTTTTTTTTQTSSLSSSEATATETIVLAR